MMRESDKLGARLLRFALVGLSGVAINGGILYVLHGWLHWSLPIGVALATELAIVNNFVWNDRWTFGRRETSLARLLRFNLSSLGGVAIALATTAALVIGGVPYLPADLAGIIAGALSNFGTSLLWTWRPQPPAAGRGDMAAAGATLPPSGM